MSPSIDLRLLRYFIAVAEEGHLTKAAERIGIQQPPLSQQIRVLERELGVTLFNRLPRGMELTDSGTALLTDARALLAQLDTTVASVRRIAQGKMGRIGVGFTESASLHPFVHSVIRAFRADAPDVIMTVEESNTNELIESLRGKRLDLAFVRSPVGDASGLTIEAMLVEDMVAACPSTIRWPRWQAQEHRPACAGRGILHHDAPAQRPGPVRHHHRRLPRGRLLATGDPGGAQEPLHAVAGRAGVGVAVIPASMTRVNAEGVVYLKLTGAAELKAPLHLAYRTGSISGAARLMREEALKLSAGRKRR
jgi:DNA-binding transcriptional LysR family regulator